MIAVCRACGGGSSLSLSICPHERQKHMCKARPVAAVASVRTGGTRELSRKECGGSLSATQAATSRTFFPANSRGLAVFEFAKRGD